MRLGFLASLEAASALLLVFFAAHAIALYGFPQNDAQGFYLCSDAAVLLAKSGSFADAHALQAEVEELSSLSGMCIEARSEGVEAKSPCLGDGGEKYTFELAIWSEGRISSAQVGCLRGE